MFMENQLPSKESKKPEGLVLKTEYTDLTPKEESGAHLIDLDGVFETLDADPTGNPRDVYGQVKINGTDRTVCVRDTKNGVWICLGQETTYGGYVKNGAADTPFPTGWSVSHPTTGNYTVTHDLGHSNYVVVVTPSNVTIPHYTSRGTTNFVVNFRNVALADTDTDFFFILKVQE